MKYVSIDLETSGLNPETCQILEFGAVVDDLEDQKPLDQLPKFHAYVLPKLNYDSGVETLVGEPYALQMNVEIIKKLAMPKKHPEDKFLKDDELAQKFAEFLKTHGISEPVVAGKNYATFDSKFLDRLLNWRFLVKPHRRILDPVMLYAKKDDILPPSLSECCKRAGIDSNVTHNAVEDATMVVDLIRRGIK